MGGPNKPELAGGGGGGSAAPGVACLGAGERRGLGLHCAQAGSSGFGGGGGAGAAGDAPVLTSTLLFPVRSGRL